MMAARGRQLKYRVTKTEEFRHCETTVDFGDRRGVVDGLHCAQKFLAEVRLKTNNYC